MIIKDGEELNFRETLYDAQCLECHSKLSWEANFDADGTKYYANCCKKLFVMSVKTVRIGVYEDEE